MAATVLVESIRMISFTCKQCGKVHTRPESAAGTMIFCTCGQGTRVPWESTAADPGSAAEAAPMVEVEPVAPDLAGPRLEPITFDAGAVPATPGRSTAPPR